MQIKIKYHRDVLPLEINEKGDWIDLRCAENIIIAAGEFKLIPLGVSMQLPDGYEAHVIPRSSTFKTWDIIQANSMGLIDNSYCGDNDEWKFPALCIKDSGYSFIKKNDRICQFRIVKKMESVELIEVETLGNADRGGFGSSGTN